MQYPNVIDPAIVHYDRHLDALTVYANDLDIDFKSGQSLHDNMEPFVLTAAARANKDIVRMKSN